MKDIAIKIDGHIEPLRNIADKFGKPILLLAFRIHIATIFFASGWARFKNFLDGQWSTQIFLFDLEHPVPGLPANIAAPVTTFAELFLPILLAFGLFGRLGAAGLIIMATVIELTYNHPEIAAGVCLTKTGFFSCVYRPDHLIWMAMLLAILVFGPGKLSLDYLLRRWLKKN